MSNTDCMTLGYCIDSGSCADQTSNANIIGVLYNRECIYSASIGTSFLAGTKEKL